MDFTPPPNRVAPGTGTQPTAKKSPPAESKYWERRRKNNLAAKKSRDARRIRENQLKIKLLCLENANKLLKSQVAEEREANKVLKERIKRLEEQKSSDAN